MLFWVESALPRPNRGEGIARLICTLQEASVAVHPLLRRSPKSPSEAHATLDIHLPPTGHSTSDQVQYGPGMAHWCNHVAF